MEQRTIDLDIDYARAGLRHVGPAATLRTYILDHDAANRGNRKRPFVIICPGGGYNHLSFREGEPVAVKMNSFGYNAAILNYSLAPNRFPTQLLEAAAALRVVREYADEWHVDENRIIIMGFSAGAHVAGSLGTMWKDRVITEVLGGRSADYRPSLQCLCYPVITAGEYAHRGSFECLIGDDPALYDLVSLEKRVTSDTVPTFIWHTFADRTVPVENSLLMAAALRRHDVPCELHIFNRGKHGLALATEETNTADGLTIEPECAVWPELFRAAIEPLGTGTVAQCGLILPSVAKLP